MYKGCFLLTILLFIFLQISAQPPTEKLIKEKIANLSNHQSTPGDRRSINFHEYTVGKGVNWTMEFGNSAAADKNTKVYRVVARFVLNHQTYNTASGKVYSTNAKEHKRAYAFYKDKTGVWACNPLGLSSGLY